MFEGTTEITPLCNGGLLDLCYPSGIPMILGLRPCLVTVANLTDKEIASILHKLRAERRSGTRIFEVVKQEKAERLASKVDAAQPEVVVPPTSYTTAEATQVDVKFVATAPKDVAEKPHVKLTESMSTLANKVVSNLGWK